MRDGNLDFASFFPPGTNVLALPSWRNARLYLPAQHPLQRWEQSSLYPASRMGARFYRLLLRLGAAAGIAKTRTVRSSNWPLAEFARDVLPQSASAVVLVGTPGPAQQITVQLRDGKGRVLCYLKCAEKEASRRRLRQEWCMLANLPGGVGPKAVKFGPLGDREALIQSPIPGKLLPATLPPPEDLTDLLDSLVVLPPVPLEAHPWVRRMRDRGVPGSDAWFQPLSGRDWPVTIQHGDFAPWNLLRRPDGALRAIDWEYGTLEGFPYLDLAYYILQTSALIYRRAPLEAARYATEYLFRPPTLALNKAEAWAVTRLAAYDAYQKALEDGQPSNTKLQAWRRTIWENEMLGV